MKRTLKVLAVSLGVVVALVVVLFVAAVAFVDLDKLVNEQVAKVKPDLEQRLGRKLSIGKVTTRVFPTLGGRVEAVTIAADPSQKADDRPLLQLGSVGFELALLKAVFSFGKHIEVTHVDIAGLRLSVVRFPDGHLSFQDIVDRQSTDEAPPKPPAPDDGPSPDTQALLASLSIERVRITDAEVRLVDLQTAAGQPREHLIRKLNLRLDDVRLASAMSVSLTAAVFSEATNLELKATVGPLPANLQLEGLPRLGGLKLVARDLDLSPLAPYLAGRDTGSTGWGTGLGASRLSADLSVGPVDGPKPVTVSGTLGLRGLEFKGGKRFDAAIDTSLRALVGPDGLSAVDLEHLELTLGTVKLAAAGSLADLGGTPKFQGFTLRSTTLDLGALLSYYPAAATSLPQGLRLEGAGRLDIAATGDAQTQTVKGELDLAGLEVLLPDTLTKPAGTAMALKVDGDFTASDAQLRGLTLVLDELELDVSGSVKGFDAPAVDLALSAKPFSFDGLVRLLPAAKSALAEAQAKAEGDGKLSGHVRGTARSLDLAFELGLLGCKLDLPSAKVDGDLRLSVSARGDPKRDLVATLDFDADKAVLVVPGKIDKAASTPWRVKASVERRGERLDVKGLEVRLAELSLTAQGQLDLKTDSTNLAIAMPRLDLEKFARTVTAIPPALARGGFVDAKLALRGNPEKLESLQLVVSPFTARLGKSDLAGELTLANLAKPKVSLSVRSSLLDLDELSPPAQTAAPGSAPAPATTPGEAPKGRQVVALDDPSLKDYQLAGAVDLRRVLVRGETLTNFRGRVRLENGILTLEDCSFGLYDGTITAAGTRVEIWKGRMPFKANLSVKGVEMDRVLAAKTRYGGALSGKADFDTQLTGDGFETAELEQALLGHMTMSLKQGRLGKAGLTESVLGSLKVLEQVPGLNLKSVKVDNVLKDLVAHLEVKDGKMTLARPLAFSVDGNRVNLGGAIGIGGGLFLSGEYFISGALLDRATGGRCKSGGEVGIPLTVGGSIDAPQFRPDGAAIIAGLARSCLGLGTAGGALLDRLGLGGGGSKPSEGAPAPTPAPDVGAQAQAERDRLERERKQLEERARQELEAQEKKAKDALRGLFGR